MGLFSPSPQTSTSSGTSTSTYTPDPSVTAQWGPILGTLQGLTTGPQGIVNNYNYSGQMVASPTDLMNQYWQQAGAAGQWTPDLTGQITSLGQTGANLYNSQVSPNQINLPQYNSQSFQPGQLNVPSFGTTPTVSSQQVQAPSTYTPQQVQAQMVSAPGSVNPITGIASVSAPSLQNYQMGAAQQVSSPTLQNYSMQAAGNVAPSAQASTQSWTNPGTAQQYMNPYTQQVVNAQLSEAQEQEQQQLQMQAGQAAQAGAFGGSRAAVEAANTSLGYQQLAAQLQAQGLQSSYSQGMQQFNQEQGLGLQAQTTNIQSGLQAALSNQQMQQQANTQNLASQLQTQQLGTQSGLQAALANQQAGLTVGSQNLAANLQTQGLGAQLGMQASLANQSMDYQTQLANQQAQEFGYNQQLQAALSNQQAGLTAQQLNQQAGLQAGLASMGYQYGASQTNAANALAASQGNQAALMQALGMQYQGGLQGALQSQQLGLSGAEYGGSLGLNAAQAGYGLQQSQQGLNMQALNSDAALQNQAAQLVLQQYGAGLQGLGALQTGAQSNQSYDQALLDAQYQNWQNSLALPMQATNNLAAVTAMQPMGYTTNNAYQGTSTTMPSQPSIFQQAIGGSAGILGLFGGLFGRKGGLSPEGFERGAVKRTPHGLERVKIARMPRREPTGLARAA